MKQYQVDIRPTAEADILNRFQQIQGESPQNAIAWYLSIIDAIESLSQLAERCPIAPESDHVSSDIRHLIIGSYRVLYTVKDNTANVLHLRHSAKQRML